ncbi:MAG: arylesterase [Filomicrobium sp.]
MLGVGGFSAMAKEETNDKPVRIVALGDSLTAGYELPASAAFPAQLEVALKKRGKSVTISNAGVSGDTTSGGLQRLDWAVPDGTEAVILELGANDALRGVPPQTARTNLDTIISRLKSRGIKVLLAGMRSPQNWGKDYVDGFESIYPDLAKKHETLLYPFFMEGVALDPDLVLIDGLHPNAKGVSKIVEGILPDVEKLIGQVIELRAK